MTEFWMGIGMIVAAPVIGVLAGILAITPVACLAFLVPKALPEDDRLEARHKIADSLASLAWLCIIATTVAVAIKGFCFIF